MPRHQGSPPEVGSRGRGTAERALLFGDCTVSLTRSFLYSRSDQTGTFRFAWPKSPRVSQTDSLWAGQIWELQSERYPLTPGCVAIHFLCPTHNRPLLCSSHCAWFLLLYTHRHTHTHRLQSWQPISFHYGVGCQLSIKQEVSVWFNIELLFNLTHRDSFCIDFKVYLHIF